MDTKLDASEGATPTTHVRTEVEVPSQGIHRTVVSDSQSEVTSAERRNGVRKRISLDPEVTTRDVTDSKAQAELNIRVGRFLYIKTSE